MRAILCLLALSVATQAAAQDFPNPKPQAAHEELAKDAGTWDCDISMYFQGPDGKPAEPVKFKGKEINTLVCGGLYVQTDYTSDMGARTFEGHGLMGYDPRTKEYVGTWVDNFSSVPTQMRGKLDEKTGKMTVYSEVVDLESGQVLKQKQVTTRIDESTKKFEIFLVMEQGGKEIDIKLMDMTCRKQSKAD